MPAPERIDPLEGAIVIQWTSTTDEISFYTNISDNVIERVLKAFINAVAKKEDQYEEERYERRHYTVCVIWRPEDNTFTYSDNCGSIGLVTGIVLNTIDALPKLKKFPITDYLKKVPS